MRNGSYKRCREYQNARFRFSNFPEKRTAYEILWNNTVEPDRPQIAIQWGSEKMRFASRITKATIQTFTPKMVTRKRLINYVTRRLLIVFNIRANDAWISRIVVLPCGCTMLCDCSMFRSLFSLPHISQRKYHHGYKRFFFSQRVHLTKKSIHQPLS